MTETATKTAAPQTVQTVTLTIDGQSVTTPRGSTVLDACKGAGIPVPTFCWHPKLKSVGACRICYVEIEKFHKLMVSCATEAIDGMVVHTDSEKCREGRKAVIEFILLDHPLDCPTCDKGGECDLQDHAFDYGLTDQTRFDFGKFRFKKDTNKDSTFDDLKIGPEMVRNQNRCILCFKCTRANEEAFGEHDIGVYYRGNVAEINSAPGEEVDSLYSGNLVEICPVGALTSSDWRYKIRVWNTRAVDSIDPFHSDGANIKLWKDGRSILRATSRPNDEIDEGWISDISRYGYQIATSERRLRTPLIKRNGTMVQASWKEALTLISKRLGEIKEKKGAPSLAGAISPNMDLATLHAFNKFVRCALGSNNVEFRTSYANLPVETGSTYEYMASRSFVIADTLKSDATLVIGSDLMREHPNLHLWVRQAVNQRHGILFTANPYQTKSADCSADELIINPGTEEVFLNGLALSLIKQGLARPDVDVNRIDTLLRPNSVESCAKICGIAAARITNCAESLGKAKFPTLIAGEIVSQSVERENISNSLFNLSILLGIEAGNHGQSAILAHSANSAGACALGVYPELTPDNQSALAKVLPNLPELDGLNWDKMLHACESEELAGMIIVGANPMQSGVDHNHIKKALESLEFLVVADLFETQTTALADIVLPLSSFAEYSGSFINLEGQRQEFAAGMRPVGESRPGFEALNAIAEKLGFSLYADIITLDSELSPLLESYKAPEKRPLLMESHYDASADSTEGKLALYVGNALHQFGHWTEHAHSLCAFDPEVYIEISPMVAERNGLADGVQARVIADNGERMVLKVKISETLEGWTAFAPLNYSVAQVNGLLSRAKRVNYVTIEKIESA